jgi:hypothetical protein
MEYYNDIFSYILSQEASYKKPIEVNTKRWSMKDTVERAALYRDSDIVGVKDQFTPIKNITRPILNLQYRTEDIDVKDVDLYVDDKDKFHLSFLVKKYHDDVFVQEHDLDEFFDDLNRSRIDFGAGLSKSLADGTREVVPLQSIVFCDQTDILSGPIGLKHYYSPDQLMDMKDRGWGKKTNGATATIEDVIALSRDEKKNQDNSAISETPGRYIEVFEVHGNLPKKFADDQHQGEEYETRMYICCFYQKKGSTGKSGIILYTAPETESPFKLIKRDPIFGRALGFGGAEELFEPQLWVNYAMIRGQQMLDSASKTLLGAVGPNSAAIANRQKVTDMDNNEIIDLGDSKLEVIDTFPRNHQLFESSVEMWQDHAEKLGAATDPLQGEQSTAGTPFAAIQAQIQQGMGLHDYRRGQFSKHIEEIYKDTYIPFIEKEITKGTTFLSELSLEELQYVSDALVECETEKAKKQYVLDNFGQAMTPEMEQMYAQKVKDSFRKKGNKHFIEILKGEFKNSKLGVKVSVAGKSKNMGKATDALVNILRFAFSNPQGFVMTMQIPGMSNAFNQIVEYAGLSPVDFSGMDKVATQMQQQQAQAQPQPQGQPQQPQPSPMKPQAYAQ